MSLIYLKKLNMVLLFGFLERESVRGSDLESEITQQGSPTFHTRPFYLSFPALSKVRVFSLYNLSYQIPGDFFFFFFSFVFQQLLGLSLFIVESYPLSFCSIMWLVSSCFCRRLLSLFNASACIAI